MSELYKFKHEISFSSGFDVLATKKSLWVNLELNSDSIMFFKASKQMRANCLTKNEKLGEKLSIHLSPKDVFKILFSSFLLAERSDNSLFGNNPRFF